MFVLIVALRRWYAQAKQNEYVYCTLSHQCPYSNAEPSFAAASSAERISTVATKFIYISPPQQNVHKPLSAHDERVIS